MLTEVSGKAAAYVNGVLSVKRKAFVLEAPQAVNQTSVGYQQQNGAADSASKASGKRKAGASNPTTMSPSGSIINGGSSQRVEYREKSAILLGQVDEDKLERQVKAVRPLLLPRKAQLIRSYKVDSFVQIRLNKSLSVPLSCSTTRMRRCTFPKDRVTRTCL